MWRKGMLMWRQRKSGAKATNLSQLFCRGGPLECCCLVKMEIQGSIRST